MAKKITKYIEHLELKKTDEEEELKIDQYGISRSSEKPSLPTKPDSLITNLGFKQVIILECLQAILEG